MCLHLYVYQSKNEIRINQLFSSTQKLYVFYMFLKLDSFEYSKMLNVDLLCFKIFSRFIFQNKKYVWYIIMSQVYNKCNYKFKYFKLHSFYLKVIICIVFMLIYKANTFLDLISHQNSSFLILQVLYIMIVFLSIVFTKQNYIFEKYECSFRQLEMFDKLLLYVDY